MKNGKNFNQIVYWKNRVSRNIDLSVVGHRSLGRAYNKHIYRRRIEVINSITVKLTKPISRMRVLDIGCGSGFYVDYWHNLGIKDLIGVDISPESVSLLTKRYPGFTFHAIDITNPLAFSTIKGKFDLITLFDITYHIIDDNSAAHLFQNIAQMLAKDGMILTFDHICRKDYSLVKHVRFRGYKTYQTWLHSSGLSISKRIPLFFLLEPPIFGFKLIDMPVAGIYRIAGILYRLNDLIGHCFGSLFYKFDQIVLSMRLRLPNHELLIIKRNHLKH